MEECGRTEKLRNDFLMFQQHQGESLLEAWTRFKNLLQKSLIMAATFGSKSKSFMTMSLPPQDEPLTNWPVVEHQVQRLMEAYIASMQPIKVKNITFSCVICSGPHETQYCMENPKKTFVEYASSRTDEAGDKYVESLELGKNGFAFIQDEMPKMIEDLGLFTLPCRLGNSEPFDTLADLGACVNIIPLYLFKNLNIGLLKETNHVFGLADGTKSYPDSETPLLVGRGFLATANAVIDCRKAKIAVGEGITRDRAWHAKIRLIDLDGEELTKTLQSVPTFRKISKKEDSREIINLDHFYDM
nr:hypothetical protein [Tanacetum cinerariifolium]